MKTLVASDSGDGDNSKELDDLMKQIAQSTAAQLTMAATESAYDTHLAAFFSYEEMQHLSESTEKALSRRFGLMADDQTMALVGRLGSATATVPLSADVIHASEAGRYAVNYIAAVLLAVIAWLLTFAGPVMISRLPQAEESTMTDYYSGIPGLALMLTGYLITHRPKGK